MRHSHRRYVGGMLVCCAALAALSFPIWAGIGAAIPSPSARMIAVRISTATTSAGTATSSKIPAGNPAAGSKGFDWGAFLTGVLAGALPAAVLTAWATFRRDTVNGRRTARREAVEKARSAASKLRGAALELSKARLSQGMYSPATLMTQTGAVMLMSSELSVRVIDSAMTLQSEKRVVPLISRDPPNVLSELQPLENGTSTATAKLLQDVQQDSTEIDKSYTALSKALSELERKLTQLLLKRGGRK